MKRRRRPLYWGNRFARVFLAAALFVSDGTSLRAARDLWSERRQAIRSTRSGPPYASRTTTGWDPLAAAFPSMEKVSSLPPSALHSHDALPSWLSSAVGLYADVGEFYPPSSGEQRVLIHIQDLHEVEEAQRNIAAVLEQLAAGLGDRNGLLVGLEGAAGAFRTNDFRSLAPPAVLRRTANRFLKAGTLSGSEFFSLTTENPVRLWGTEDPLPYESNIRALTSTFSGQSRDDAVMQKILLNIENLKEKFYPPIPRKLDRFRGEYDGGKMSFALYAGHLTEGIPPERWGPNLRLFLKAVSLERGLVLSRVAEDQKRLLAQLAPEMTRGEVDDLMDVGLASRVGRVPYSHFHQLLKKMCATHGLNLMDFPGLNAYADYAAEVEGINPSDLLKEMDAVFDQQMELHLSIPRLAALARLDEDARLLDKLNRFVLTSEDYKKLVSRREAMVSWPQRMAALHRSLGHPSGLWPSPMSVLERHEPFYQWAEKRNIPLVENLLRPWTEEAPAVLVAGGYHAEGIRLAARAKGLGYISLTPRISSTKDFPSSLGSFRSQEGPAEWIFKGDQSGLHAQLMTATDPVSVASQRATRDATAFVTAVAGDQAATVLESGLPQEGPLFRQLSREIQRIATAARSLGLGMRFEKAEPLSPDGEGQQRVNLSFYVQDLRVPHSGSPKNFVASVAVTLKGPLRAPSLVVDVRPSGIVRDWVAGVRVVEGWLALSQWGPRLWDSMATTGSRVAFDLGRATRSTAVALMTPLRWMALVPGFSWLARMGKEWTLYVRLREDRATRDLALGAAPGLRAVMLSRLAEQHLRPFLNPWEEIIDGSVKRMIGGISNLTYTGLTVSNTGSVLTLSSNSSQNPVTVQFRVSDSRALIENPDTYSLFQMVQTADPNSFIVSLQMAALSRAEAIPDRVLGRMMREIGFRMTGMDASLAERRAIRPLDELMNRRDLLLYNLRSQMADIDNRLILAMDSVVPLMVPTGINPGDLLNGDPEKQWAFTQGGEPWFGSLVSREVGLSSLLSGADPQTDLLENPDLLAASFRKRGYSPVEATRLAEGRCEDHLRAKVAGLTLLEDFVKASQDKRNFFPWDESRKGRVTSLEKLVLNRLTFVAAEQGERAALDPANLSPADFNKHLLNGFFPLAKTLLSFLSSTGVRVGSAGDPAVEKLVNDMFRIYVTHFYHGVRRMGGSLAARTQGIDAAQKKADAPAVLVVHLSEDSSTSPAVRALLENILERVSRENPVPFSVLVLRDDEGQSEMAFADSLAARLQKDFPDAAGKDVAFRAIQAPGFLEVVEARKFRSEGVISLNGVLQWVKTQWTSTGWVDVFTQNANDFRLDGEESLAWALYENSVLVSQWMEAEIAKRRIQEFIQRNA